MTRPSMRQLVSDLWHAHVPLRDLLWRHMVVFGSTLNLLCSLGALGLLAAGVDAVWAVALHFAPLPWNALLVSAIWRHPQGTPVWSMVAMAWFLGMLVV